MCTGWCPLAADWGSVAEIAGVVVALFGAVAVAALAYRANKLGEQANRHALESAELARKMQEESERKEAEVLLVLLSGEISSALARANELAAVLSKETTRHNFAFSLETRAMVVSYFGNIILTAVVQAMPRIHVLPATLSHALARAVSLQRVLAARAAFAQQPALLGTSHGQEFDYLRQWLNVMIADLEIVDAAADFATRHGTQDRPF